jgi:hypothetical protein
MMNQLVMPFALTRFQIDGDNAFTKQGVSRALAAIIVMGRQLNR